MKLVDQSTITKPLPECSDNYLLWRVVYFAILNVQFNILLFQLKDVTQPMPIYEGSQGDLSRGDPDDPSEFCQRPPESSGRCSEVLKNMTCLTFINCILYTKNIHMLFCHGRDCNRTFARLRASVNACPINPFICLKHVLRQ